MLIVLTGLHRAGKSHFCYKSGVPQKHGIEVFNKKQVIISLCENDYKKQNLSLDDLVVYENFKNGVVTKTPEEFEEAKWNYCNEWYGRQMDNDPMQITKRITDFIILDKDGKAKQHDVILDAVHNNKEWDIIHSHFHDSALLLFVTPKEVRDSRGGNVEFLESKNIRRIGFWCKDKYLPPLICMAAGWIDGSQEISQIEQDFLAFAAASEQALKEQTAQTLKIEPVDIQDLVLKKLIEESEALALENARLQKQLNAENRTEAESSEKAYVGAETIINPTKKEQAIKNSNEKEQSYGK